jgi:hypothetical protein
MRVKALQKFYYNRRDILPGESFDMDDRESGEARILSVLGKIEILPTQPAKLETRALVAEEPPAAPEPPPVEQPVAAPMTTQSADALTGRRVYRRRDMRAEDK